MKTPEVRVDGVVTASTPISITVTPGPDSMDAKPAGTLTAVVLQGSGLENWKAVVGDRLTIRING
jgi:hypothetical protein